MALVHEKRATYCRVVAHIARSLSRALGLEMDALGPLLRKALPAPGNFQSFVHGCVENAVHPYCKVRSSSARRSILPVTHGVGLMSLDLSLSCLLSSFRMQGFFTDAFATFSWTSIGGVDRYAPAVHGRWLRFVHRSRSREQPPPQLTDPEPDPSAHIALDGAASTSTGPSRSCSRGRRRSTRSCSAATPPRGP